MSAAHGIRPASRRPAGRGRAAFGRTPLRVKLVAVLLLLVTAGLVGSGWAGATTLREYLVGRVDSQLRAAEQPILQQARNGDLNSGGAPDGNGGRGGKGGGGEH